MKKLILVLIAICCNFTIAIAQKNLTEFIRSIQVEMPRLEDNQDKKIYKFMRYALKKYPALKNDSITKVPIYSICVYKKYVKEHWRNDSLFVVLNPKSIRLNAVLTYNNEMKVMYIDTPFWGLRDQAIYSGWIEYKIFEIVRNVNPQFICTLYGDTNIIFTIKNNSLTFWKLIPSERLYQELTPMQFFESFENRYDLWEGRTDVPFPPIYTR